MREHSEKKKSMNLSINLAKINIIATIKTLKISIKLINNNNRKKIN